MNETSGSTEDATKKPDPTPAKSASTDPRVRFLIGAVVVLAIVVGGGFALGLLAVDDTPALEAQIAGFAFLTQTRVQVLDEQGNVITEHGFDYGP